MNKTNTRTFSTWSGILLLLCVWSTIGLATEVYYVSPQGPGGDFKSWAQAADNIQAALDVAEDGDTVRVASGEYVLSAQIEITNSISLIGESGPVETVINGGYTPGGATTNRCLLVSGGDPFITGFTFSNGASFYEDGGGILMANATLSNCVVRNNRAYLLEKGSRLGGGISASGSTIVDSWIIENLIEAATFNTSGWSGGGGGINLTSSSMTDCVISNNAIVGGYASTMLGGGVRADGASTILRGCLISDNSNARGWGGGLRIDGVTIDGCTIVRNRAMSYGGGCLAQTGTITNSLFAYNYASVAAGGLYTRYTTTKRFASVYDTDFIGNTNGGAWLSASRQTEGFLGSQNLMSHCRFDGNTGYGVSMSFTNDLLAHCEIRNTEGVGVHCNNGILRNCLIVDNMNTTSEGGGLLIRSTCTETTVSGCTIAGNVSSGYDGSGIRIEATAPTSLQISSSIIANNGATGLDDMYDAGGVSANALQYSCMGANPGFTGTGILVADPKFKSPTTGNYRLRDGSPCRDQGLTEPWMVDALDLDGNPRVQFSTVDMGAYELGAMPGFILQIR